MDEPSIDGVNDVPQLTENYELLAAIFQQELNALGPKEDAQKHDEARVKSALNCMKALKDLEDVRKRSLNFEGPKLDDPQDVLELYQRLRIRIDQIIEKGEGVSLAVSG